MLLLSKDNLEVVIQLPCLLGHPVQRYLKVVFSLEDHVLLTNRERTELFCIISSTFAH